MEASVDSVLNAPRKIVSKAQRKNILVEHINFSRFRKFGTQSNFQRQIANSKVFFTVSTYTVTLVHGSVVYWKESQTWRVDRLWLAFPPGYDSTSNKIGNLAHNPLNSQLHSSPVK